MITHSEKNEEENEDENFELLDHRMKNSTMHH